VKRVRCCLAHLIRAARFLTMLPDPLTADSDTQLEMTGEPLYKHGLA